MKAKNKTQLWLKYGLMSFLAITALGALYFFSDYLLIAKNNIQLEKIINEKPIAKALAFTNENGQKWYISNPGKNVFNIGANIKDGPKIVKAEIDPLKVSVGQKQTMTLEVNSNQPLTKVIAEITTDHKTITVELKQTNERDLTLDDVKNSPFLVKESGEVVFSAEKSPTSKFVYDNLVNRFFETAQASNVRHYTFSGDWIVHDTGETTYRTKFIAYDSNNKSNSTTLAWSDPCSLPISKNIDWAVGGLSGMQFGYFEDSSKTNFILTNQSGYATCSEDTISGIESVNYTVQGDSTLNITGSKIVRTPGNIITLIAGSYIILDDQPNTKIAKGYIWLKDNDGDGFFTNSPVKQFTTDNNPPSGGSTGGGSELSYYLNRKISGLVNKITSNKLFANRTKADEIQCASTGQVTWSKTSTINNYNNYLLNNNTVLDCDDSRSHAKPGSTLTCSIPRSDNSYDYDCNGIAEQAWPRNRFPANWNGICTWDPDETGKNPYGGDCINNMTGPVYSGWTYGGNVPACGVTGNYRWYNNSQFPTCANYTNRNSCEAVVLVGGEDTRKQECK